jgi:hypothetical protein
MEKVMIKLVTILLLITTTTIFSQQVNVANAVPTGSEWYVDNIVLDNEPLGKFSGVKRMNGTIYVAVNDTLSTSNLGLIILSSTDNGWNWSLFPTGITYRGAYEKIKMLGTTQDSLYCFFQIGDQVYTWNFLSGNFNPVLAGNYRTFDVVSSSTGGLYIVVDSLPNNSILRYSSLTGGSTWQTRGNITAAGAMPKWTMSATGDTLILNYYGPVLPDTANSIIRAARYRETSPGTLGITGSFIDVATEIEPKYEFKTAYGNGQAWLVYTLGEPGSRNIMGRKSNTHGASYNPPVPIAANPAVDEYWFDVKTNSTPGDFRFDLICFLDDAGTSNDRLVHYEALDGENNFTMREQINDFTPVYSDRGYSPKIVQLSGGDFGALWVGESTGRKLFWDRLFAIPVELISFTASQSGDQINLTWATASETNNKGFELEKFQNDSWNNIAFVEGNGTTAEKNVYTYSDIVNSSGIIKYRLKQIDYNGTFSFSDEIEIEVNLLPASYSLGQNYPNPFNPATIINFSLASDSKVTFRIFDLLGREISVYNNHEMKAGHHTYNFNGSNFSSGIYLYQLEAVGVDGTKFNEIKKMTLMK